MAKLMIVSSGAVDRYCNRMIIGVAYYKDVSPGVFSWVSFRIFILILFLPGT